MGDDDRVCAELGSPPFPGAMGYRCTEPPEHPGMLHVATTGDGQVLDTWPRSDVDRPAPAVSRG